MISYLRFRCMISYLVYNDVVPVKRNLPTVLQMVILQFWPHEAGGRVDHLLDGLRAGLVMGELELVLAI